MMKYLLLSLITILMLPLVSYATPIYPDPPEIISGGGFVHYTGDIAFEFNTPVEVTIDNVWNPDKVYDLMLIGYSLDSSYIFSSYLGNNIYLWDPDIKIAKADSMANPLPNAFLLLGTGLVGLFGFRKKNPK